jgi:hypothetical protein
MLFVSISRHRRLDARLPRDQSLLVT